MCGDRPTHSLPRFQGSASKKKILNILCSRMARPWLQWTTRCFEKIASSMLFPSSPTWLGCLPSASQAVEWPAAAGRGCPLVSRPAATMARTPTFRRAARCVSIEVHIEEGGAAERRQLGFVRRGRLAIGAGWRKGCVHLKFDGSRVSMVHIMYTVVPRIRKLSRLKQLHDYVYNTYNRVLLSMYIVLCTIT